MRLRPISVALLLAASTVSGLAQDRSAEAPKPEAPAEAPAQRSIRNAPSARALELSAYIYSAANVCGYRIGTPAFEALLAKQGTKPEDVALRGPFGGRILSIFQLMSNDMAKHREESCLAVAGEYGPEGNLAKDVLLPPGPDAPAVEAPAPAAR